MNNKGFISITVAVIVGVLALGLAGTAVYYQTQKDDDRSSTDIVTNTIVRANANTNAANANANTNSVNTNTSINTNTDPTAGWETYTNTEYGFSFLHPTDWTISTDTDGGGALVVRVENATDSFIEFLPTGGWDHGTRNTELTSLVMIGQERVLKVKFVDEPYYAINYFPTYRENGWTQYNRIEVIAQDNDAMDIIDQIFESFEFSVPDSVCPLWPTYTDDEYGWTMDYPCDWTAEKTVFNDADNNPLEFELPSRYVIFRDPTEEFRLFVGLMQTGDEGSTINRTGVGAGEFMAQPPILVAGTNVPVRHLVFESKLKEVFFYSSGSVTVDGFQLTSTFDQTKEDVLELDNVDLYGALQKDIGQMILQSLELPD